MTDIKFTEETLQQIVRNHDVIIAMGSVSDWPKEKGMSLCCELLLSFGVTVFPLITSAHRTPERVDLLAKAVESEESKVKVVVAGAGGAAHLPGLLKAHLLYTPVIGVPIKSDALSGVDSLYSIVQMPPGVPVGTMAIGVSGAKNAAILAAEVVAQTEVSVRKNLINFRRKQTNDVGVDPRQANS